MPRTRSLQHPSPSGAHSLLVLRILTIVLLAATAAPASDEFSDAEQQALQAAARRMAPTVLQIRTIGGLEQVDDRVLAQGPTTGLAVRSDGYIVSSAFGFAQNPSSILVRLPDGTQRPAELVGRDDNRMLVLLKIDVPAGIELPVAEPAPLDEVRVGQWAIALGRTFDPQRVNLSVGVVSALGRQLGRAIQTDAKVSAANYGGPLVDLRGRVLGVLVPMAPPSPGGPMAETSEVAGVEYYDSGIAFAIPLETVVGQLDRWIAAGELRRGVLGIGMTAGSPHAVEPRITSIWPGSPAETAGWQTGDLVVAVDGRPVSTQIQLRTEVAPRYAGDSLAVRVRRGQGDDAQELDTRVTLVAKLPPYQQGFLGVLPQRGVPAPSVQAEAANKAKNEEPAADAAKPDLAIAGVAIRAIWPDSPAARAGLLPGDRVTKINDATIADAADAAKALASLPAGKETAVAAVRAGKSNEYRVQLAPLPTDLLAASNLQAAAELGTDNATASDELALVELKLPEFPMTARGLAPPATEASAGAPGLLLWLGGSDPEVAQELARSWRTALGRAQVALVLAEPGDEAGWTGDDAEYLARLLPLAASRFGVDPRRIVVAGEGKGGQMALALALQMRGRLAGVAAVAAPLPRTAKVPENAPGAPLAVLMIATENSPFSALVRRDAVRLIEAGYPVSQTTRRATIDHAGLLDLPSRGLIARWLDGLDRF
ncbi:MAG: PDZ domain-containing protein [Pirellulales bacterium]|nr:PDZ domain-containing protein [Pirellulales bacterium]